MSAFNALNFTSHDEQLEAEEHSRELQVEESFKIFQGALYDLRAKRFAEADAKFEDLFSMEVLKPNKWGFYKYSSPTLDSLRYLAYRNRGMYYCSYLIENYSKLDPQDIVDNILKVVENLIESIQHSEADISVTRLLTQIFRSYKSKRLERLVLEHELTKRENHLFLLGRKKKGLLPSLIEIVVQYESLLKDIKADELTSRLITEGLVPERVVGAGSSASLDHILSEIKKMKTIDEHTMKELDAFQVSLQECSWEAIATSLKQLVPHVKTSILVTKSTDPYHEVEFPIEAVSFIITEPDKSALSSTQISEEGEASEDAESTRDLSPSASTLTAPGETGDKTEQSSDQGAKKRAIDDSENQKFVQRSSKRFKEKDQEATEEDALRVHVIFLSELSAMLGILGLSTPSNVENLSISMIDPENRDQLPQYDLIECLKSWNSWHTEIYMRNDTGSASKSTKKPVDTDFLQVNTLLRSNVFGDKMDAMGDFPAMDDEGAMSFLDEINKHPMHFQEVRFRLLVRLLSRDGNSGIRPIVDRSWSSKLYDAVEWFLFGVERNLYDFISENMESHSYLALSVHEMLVNMLGRVCEEVTAKKLHGNKSTDLNHQRNQLESKIEKWHALLQLHQTEDKEWLLYFQWSHYCFLQYCCEIIDDRLLAALTSIEKSLTDGHEDFHAVFPNYHHIPPLHIKAIHSQSRRIRIIRQISIIDTTESDPKDEDEQQNISLLRQVLLLDIYPEQEPPAEILEMLRFISGSPFLLKVKLWEVLFNSSLNKGDTQIVLQNYFHVLTFFSKFLTSDKYYGQPTKVRQQLLLITQNSIEDFSSKFSNFILRNGQQYNGSIDRSNFELLIRAFFLFYPMLYFESLSKSDASLKSFFRKATKSSTKMKNAIANLATILIFFYDKEAATRALPQRNMLTADLIECLHGLLGEFKSCDASEGKLLKLSESLLCQSTDNASLAPLKQILWCRYHYLIAGDSFQPKQHVTKEVPMDKSNSLSLGVYLIKLQSQGRNPMLASGSKGALKPVFDSIIDTVGDPTSSGNHVVERNKFLLESYLESPITARMFQEAFTGENCLILTAPNDELQQSMDAGLFYVASVQALNLYGTRKKSMQARPSELDSIINMLKTDIIYNTGRFESWYLLGRCYSFIVEDDLMWTSDKLSSIEKKSTIALKQRTAVLCYIMSLKHFYAKKVKHLDDHRIVKRVFEALGTELISGSHKPMEKLCFSWRRPQNALLLTDEGELVERKEEDNMLISSFNINQAILFCFYRANQIDDKSSEDNQRNWMNFYHIGRVLFKNDRSNFWKHASENILESCHLADESSAPKDPIIEPHYYLVDICYKTVKEALASPTTMLEILAKNNSFFKQEDSFWSLDNSLTLDYQKKVFYDKVIKLLTFILASDKKKWHHRPKYRIAKILLDEFNNVEGAANEIATLMSIKSTHKNLVNIWKPDHERPGKHFVYAYQYVMFYLDLLRRLGDFNSIGLVCKKIRRFGSGMAYVNKAAEHATSLYIQCARDQLQLDEKIYIEKILPSLNYQHFLGASEDLCKTFQVSDYSEKTLQALKISYQLKKGNNGVAFDGICLAIFLKFFYLPKSDEFSSEDKSSPEQIGKELQQEPRQLIISSTTSSRPSSQASSSQKSAIPRKRVSKKDAFDKIRLIVEKIT